MKLSSIRQRARSEMTALRRHPVLHRGDRYECPCCGQSFGSFAAHRQRENVTCPGCWSLERHRTLWLFMQRETDLLDEPKRVLHIAPEPVLTRHLADRDNIDYLSGDIDGQRAMEAINIMDIPKPDASFDVVLCNHVLEHVDDDRQAMREFHRVLKPGGYALMQHPVDPARETTYEDPTVVTPEDRMREFEQEDHVRIYGRDFKDRLEEAGFLVTRREYDTELSAEERERYRLAEDDSLQSSSAVYVCVRPASP